MTGATRRQRIRELAPLLALLVLALVPKLAILHAPRADLYLVGSRSVAQTFHGEEIHRGTTAYELAHGPILPFFDYTYAPFFGGSLVESALAAPLFRWLGSSIAVLKLVPLAIHLLSVVALWLALRRLAGAGAAFAGGLLLALPPPGYVVHTLTAFGTHVETNALSLGLLALFLAVWWRTDGRAPPRGLAFLWGLLAGFSIYFGYIVLLTLAVLALARLLRDPRTCFGRDTGIALAGVLLGLAPWWAYNLGHGFAGLAIYGKPLGGALEGAPARAEGPWTRLSGLARHGFPDSSFFRALGPLEGTTWNRIYAGTLALGLAAFVVTHRRELARWLAPRGPRTELSFAPLLALQPLCFLLAYAGTSFKVGEPPEAVVSYRYVHVVWPWLFALAALGFGKLVEHGGRLRLLAWIWLLCLAGLAGAGSLALVDPARAGSERETPGYSYVAFGRFLVLSLDSRPEVVLAALAKAERLRSAEDLDALLFGMGIQIKEGLRAKGAAGPRMLAFRERARGLQQRLLEAVPSAARPYFEEPVAGEPAFGRGGTDERATFWTWYRAREKR